jgi:hypothetical protein
MLHASWFVACGIWRKLTLSVNRLQLPRLVPKPLVQLFLVAFTIVLVTVAGLLIGISDTRASPGLKQAARACMNARRANFKG